MKGLKIISVLLVLVIAAVAISGCTGETSEASKSVTDDNADQTAAQTVSPQELTQSSPAEAVGTSSQLYPDAYGRGDRVYFNDETFYLYEVGDDKATISIYPEDTKIKNGLYVKNMDTGDRVWIKPDSGNKYYFIGVTVAPIGGYSEYYESPFTSDFSLVDGSTVYKPKLEICDSMGAVIRNKNPYDENLNEDFTLEEVGEIYVGENLYKVLNSRVGSASRSGWLMFELPDSFIVTADTYLKLDLDKNEIYWKLFDVLANVGVSKNPTNGIVKVNFDGGPESHVVQAVKAKVILADGTVKEEMLTIKEGDVQIPLGAELSIQGTKAGEGKDHVIVSCIRMDGKEIIKFDDYLESIPR